MEVPVILVWFIYHDVSFVGLKLEVADAVKVYVHEDVGEHALDKISTDLSTIIVFTAKSFTYVPYEVPQVCGGQFLLQLDGDRLVHPSFSLICTYKS